MTETDSDITRGYDSITRSYRREREGVGSNTNDDDITKVITNDYDITKGYDDDITNGYKDITKSYKDITKSYNERE